MIITFAVPGVPQGKHRPRFARRGKYVHTYKAAEDEKRESVIRIAYYKAAGDIGPYSGPIAIWIDAMYSIPQSWSKKRKLDPGPKISKPDIDNIAKSVLDGLNGLAFVDDAQIIHLSSKKRWGEWDKTYVTIDRIGDSADLFAGVAAEG
jgi:Holliday junction resolvase RusA-like endonuclease